MTCSAKTKVVKRSNLLRNNEYWKSTINEIMRLWGMVGLILGQRRRRWPNIKPTLTQSLMFAGIPVNDGQTRDVNPMLV